MAEATTRPQLISVPQIASWQTGEVITEQKLQEVFGLIGTVINNNANSSLDVIKNLTGLAIPKRWLGEVENFAAIPEYISQLNARPEFKENPAPTRGDTILIADNSDDPKGTPNWLNTGRYIYVYVEIQQEDYYDSYWQLYVKVFDPKRDIVDNANYAVKAEFAVKATEADKARLAELADKIWDPNSSQYQLITALPISTWDGMTISETIQLVNYSVLQTGILYSPKIPYVKGAFASIVTPTPGGSVKQTYMSKVDNNIGNAPIPGKSNEYWEYLVGQDVPIEEIVNMLKPFVGYEVTRQLENWDSVEMYDKEEIDILLQDVPALSGSNRFSGPKNTFTLVQAQAMKVESDVFIEPPSSNPSYDCSINFSGANGGIVTGLRRPRLDADAANKKYVDDQVAMGGGGGSIPSNMVTTNTNQTLSGLKTFTNDLKMKASANSTRILEFLNSSDTRIGYLGKESGNDNNISLRATSGKLELFGSTGIDTLGKEILNVGTPTTSTSATNKSYVDGQIAAGNFATINGNNTFTGAKNTFTQEIDANTATIGNLSADFADVNLELRFAAGEPGPYPLVPIINFKGNDGEIKGLAAPTGPTYATNKKYVDDTVAAAQSKMVAGENVTINGNTINALPGIPAAQIARRDQNNSFVGFQNFNRIASYDISTETFAVKTITLEDGGTIENVPNPTTYDQIANKSYVDLEVGTKQNKLIAGQNITIQGNTISATGGGSGTTFRTATTDIPWNSGEFIIPVPWKNVVAVEFSKDGEQGTFGYTYFQYKSTMGQGLEIIGLSAGVPQFNGSFGPATVTITYIPVSREEQEAFDLQQEQELIQLGEKGKQLLSQFHIRKMSTLDEQPVEQIVEQPKQRKRKWLGGK